LNITTRTGLVGFFLALSALPISGAGAATNQSNPSDSTTDQPQTIESRLNRLTDTIRQREPLLNEDLPESMKNLIARSAWGNGGGGFANRTGPGGFINNQGGGGFVNGGGFRNGGGFWNY